jgi:hypothetical protein
MSYVQIEIGGKLRGLKFNSIARHEYLAITEGKKNPIIHSSGLIYAGLYGNCIVKREEPDFTFEDVCEWCDKVTDPNIFYKVLEVYKTTLPIPEEVKKKVAKKPVPQKNIKKRALK